MKWFGQSDRLFLVTQLNCGVRYLFGWTHGVRGFCQHVSHVKAKVNDA